MLAVSLLLGWLTPPTSAQTSTGDTLLLVLGAAGAEEFGSEFAAARDAWRKLATANAWQVTELGPSASGQTAREQLQQSLAEQAASTERLWLVLIGHGTFAKNVAKFNLEGPDVSAAELNQWLKPIAGEVVVINCSSASSPFLTELSAPQRIIVTATRSGSESNYARFGKYLAAAIGDTTADLDHDQSVSLLEAFLKATAETERFYREESRLATEHALLDDNGDRIGTPGDFYRGVEPIKSSQGGEAIDGRRAAQIILHASPDAIILPPQLADERQQIEAQIDALRGRKQLIAPDQYYSQLETLLLQLAAIYEAAEADSRKSR